MAIYVTSDAHGHRAALEEVLAASEIDLTAGDELYVLGDMIDRGPEPLGVINVVRSLPNTHVLMGNHEQLMLAALEHVAPPQEGAFDTSTMGTIEYSDWFTWTLNGGGATITQLEKLDEETYLELLDWVRELSFYEVIEAGEGDARRPYILVHAGIDSLRAADWLDLLREDGAQGVGDTQGASDAQGAGDVQDAADAYDTKGTQLALIEHLMAHQRLEDLVWIRDKFWSAHTGLVNSEGKGAVIIAGHTPSLTLTYCFSKQELESQHIVYKTEEDKGLVVPMGADDSTSGVADRIDIDAGAAAGWPCGRVALMRLDDGKIWYADVKEDE